MRVNVTQVALIQALLFGMVLCFWVCIQAPFVFAVETSEVTSQEVLVTDSSEPIQDRVSDSKKIQDTSLGFGNFSVSPVVANEKAKARDIIKKELLVTNNTAQRIDLYISVENVDPTEGVKEFTSQTNSDLSSSLASWVEITRGVIELGPNESKKIPYLIHVNLSAKPGSYYARLQFRQGAKRLEAEANKEGSSLMLNVEVSDNAKERLQLGNFLSDSSVVLGNTVSFSYLLENVGNRLVEPRGSIRIFNRRGEEVGSIPLNASGEEIGPENKKQLATAWSATGRFGKYKAFLDLEYGEGQLASVQDTVYFWVFPWKEITAALFAVVVLAIVGTYIVHMSAMAQPARARKRAESRKENEATYQAQQSIPQHSYVPQRSQRAHTSPTHLHVIQERKNNKLPEATHERGSQKQHGATITLASRGSKGNTKTHGNVIQLSSRN